MGVKPVPYLHFSEEELAGGEVRDPRVAIGLGLEVEVRVLENGKVLDDHALKSTVFLDSLTGVPNIPLSLIVREHLSNYIRSISLPLFEDWPFDVHILFRRLDMALLEI